MAVIRDAEGRPFSKWKPAVKFAYVFAETYPDLWMRVEPEHEFAPDRRWRWDYAWPSIMLAVEIDGFGYGHQAQQMIAQGHDKQNKAVSDGWRVFRFTSRHLGSRRGVEDAVQMVAEAICQWD